MKFIIPVCVLFLLVACKPVKVTQQYYNDYVNPVASIDYEDTVSANIPAELLDDYYTVDSKIVRLANQLDLFDSRIDSDMIENQKSIHPWIKQMAIFDQDQLFISGDDTLGFDPQIRAELVGLAPEKDRNFLFKNNRQFFIHVISMPDGQYKATVVEIDMDILAAEIPNHRTVIAIDDQICGPAIANLPEACINLRNSTKYSGSIEIDGNNWYWIRSMGSDNLVYLYLTQE
ncbi:hypothetical protein [Desulfomicrobium baculatum]|uniref:Lipoprotein n=1 Tax=Desulfomicrobium baculatum (strain DSM 4028 / VKM B-1378 / X) TaxID=525897 RepID=C7LR93_DESBD|nr:hypothetical protein [Desulfomicrobium baculatum]ACU89239.1 hypothetical protein Dbac_1135 [Desulfomicrobium baculatum DSM 4028]